jgi:signal transduction histidine kinase
VGLLAEIDSATEAGEFSDHLCEALCRLTSLRRAALLLYDSSHRAVLPVGSHGTDPTVVAQIEGTLEETPMAELALAEDRVVEAHDDHASHIPARYARFAGITTITCAPVAAGGRWLGVIFADRGGGRFELTADERQAMWSLGKLAALAATVQQATIQREAARRLSERIDLIREIHEGVIQRLFGLVLVLGSDEDLDAEQRLVCHDELRDVLGELRDALGRARRMDPPTTQMTVRQVLDRIGSIRDDLVVDWADGVEVPSEVEPTAQTVLLEAIRNADKHAKPTRIEVGIDVEEGNLVLEVVNDGARASVAGTGLGLRLATIEALQHSGLVEFGPLPDDRWHVRLVVPTDS